MSFCAPGERFGAFSVTPVENLFIDEYMLRAPGDFVRVYLYGLRMCWHTEGSCTPESMARALGLTDDALRDAFLYWERQGVLRRVQESPLKIEFFQLTDALFSRGKQNSEVYHYQDFNQQLQQLFGDRLLHPQDYARAYDWIEVLGLRPETVLLMTEATINERGTKDRRVTTAYLDKVARTWAEKGLHTIPAARAYLDEHRPGVNGAERVLRALGQRRPPTADEARLYARWTDELGMSHEAVEAVVPRLSNTLTPNFKYLDTVIVSLANQGVHTASEVVAAIAEREAARRALADVQDALGATGGKLTQVMSEQYERWLSTGFDYAAVVCAAQAVHARGGRLFSDVEKTLDDYRDAGAMTAGAIKALTAARADADAPVRAALSALGVRRAPSDADRTQYTQWRAQGFSHDTLLHAAHISSPARAPWPYMQRVLAAWHAQGAHELEAAMRLSQEKPVVQHAAASGARSGKEVAEHRYQQRSYTDDDLRGGVTVPPLDEDE